MLSQYEMSKDMREKFMSKNAPASIGDTSTRQITLPDNSYLFLRIQQNTCSSAVEILPFFSATHQQQELQYIEQIIGLNPDDVIVGDSLIRPTLSGFPCVTDITVVDFSNLSKNRMLIFLHTREWLQKILYGNIATKVYIIRHEGDFPITGTEIPCDCGNCLLNSLLTKEIPYRYHSTSPIQYREGYQYTVLQYYRTVPKASPKIDAMQEYCCKRTIPKLTRPVIAIFTPTIDLKAYRKYQALGSPKYISAPMIGQSELAFRMMVRKNGVQLCYTPMMNAEIFVASEEYRQELFTTSAEDRPLVAQFAANNPETLLQAAQMVARHCDAIDINLGCPQPIARRNHYGAWLMEDRDLIYRLIRILKTNLSIPVWCKIRILDTVEQTIEYAKMIEAAGCSLLTIHGRLRKSHMNAEHADWEHIRAVKNVMQIPVFANGSIATYSDMQGCSAITGCDGVMAAVGLLENPLLFANVTKEPKAIALEYLDYAERYNALMRYVRPHILQILAKVSSEEESDLIQKCSSIEELRRFVKQHAFDIRCSHASSNGFQAVFDGFAIKTTL